MGPEYIDDIPEEELEGYWWTASKRFRLGEISAKQLEDIEHIHSARQTMIETKKIRWFLSLVIVSLFAIWSVAGLITFIVSGNAGMLISLPIISLPLSTVLSYYFFSDKRHDSSFMSF